MLLFACSIILALEIKVNHLHLMKIAFPIHSLGEIFGKKWVTVIIQSSKVKFVVCKVNIFGFSFNPKNSALNVSDRFHVILLYYYENSRKIKGKFSSFILK